MSELARVKDGVLEANAEMFIIPNPPTRIHEFLVSNDTIQDFATDLLKNAGMKPADQNTIMVEVWICSDDLGTENLRCHGGSYINEDGAEERINIPDGNCPADLLLGKKEGDVVDLTFHMDDIKVILHTKLNQTGYRYKNHGRFEDCFVKVYSHATPAN